MTIAWAIWTALAGLHIGWGVILWRSSPSEPAAPTSWRDVQQMHTGPDCLCLACNEARRELRASLCPPDCDRRHPHLWLSA